jgi:transcriptional regulator with XRE-family HTH domain
MFNLGQRLKYARERKNLKQLEVAKKTGINNKTLSGYEHGRAEPDFDTLLKLAELYEVDIHWIIGKKHVEDEKLQNIIDSFDQLSESKQKIVLDLIESLLKDETRGKNKR